MTDTQASETTVLTSEAKRTRYTGEVILQEVKVDRKVNLTETGKGRPAIDLKAYETALAKNFASNKKNPPESQDPYCLEVNSEAVSTVKSRFNTAAANIDLGVRWPIVEDLGNGMTLLGLVATKREKRERKDGNGK